MIKKFRQKWLGKKSEVEICLKKNPPRTQIFRYFRFQSRKNYFRDESRNNYFRYESRNNYFRYESRNNYFRYESRNNYFRYESRNNYFCTKVGTITFVTKVGKTWTIFLMLPIPHAQFQVHSEFFSFFSLFRFLCYDPT